MYVVSWLSRYRHTLNRSGNINRDNYCVALNSKVKHADCWDWRHEEVPMAKSIPPQKKHLQHGPLPKHLSEGYYQWLGLMRLQTNCDNAQKSNTSHTPTPPPKIIKTNRNNQIWETETQWKWERGTERGKRTSHDLLQTYRHMAINKCKIKNRTETVENSELFYSFSSCW